MNKLTFDNFYRHGLQIGDIVSYSCRSLFQSYFGIHDSLVLYKEFLFQKHTRFGIRTFYSYTMFNTDSQKIIEVKTQNIKIHEVIRGK